MTQTEVPPHPGVALTSPTSREAAAGDGTGAGPEAAPETTPQPARRAPRGIRRLWRYELLGVTGAMVGLLGFTLHYAFSTQLLLPPDEHAHMAYGYYVADGELPEIDSRDRYPASATELDQRVRTAPDDDHRTVWVANHPPLYYVALAPVLTATEAAGHANAGIVGGRLLSIGFATLGVGFTYLLAREVSGGQGHVGVAAAALAAFVVQAQYTFSHAYNDGLAFLTTTAMLWAAARCVRRAPPPRAALLLSLTVAAAAATRAVGLLVGVAVVLAVVATRTLLDGRRAGRPVYLATLHAAALALPTVLLVGWFYLRNLLLYGDIGGSSYLLERFDRVPPQGSLLEIIFNSERWELIYDRLVGYTRFAEPVQLSEGALSIWRWAALVAVLGALLAVAVGRPGGRRDADGQPALLSRAGSLILLLAVLTNCAVLVQHIAGGGSEWPRYLTPTLGAMATLAAIGLQRLIPRVLPLVAVAGAATTCWVLAGPTEATLGLPPVAPWLGNASMLLAAAGALAACTALILPLPFSRDTAPAGP
jgi:hypothetical protein